MSDDRGEIIFEDKVLAAGFVQISTLVVFDNELSSGAKITYAALLWYGWKFREFPGQSAMAQDLGVTDRTIRKHLRELQQKDYIAVEQLGLGKTNRYIIRSLEQRPLAPDRNIFSGLTGVLTPPRPEKKLRSYHDVLEGGTDNEQQQAQSPASASQSDAPSSPDSPDTSRVVVAHFSTPLTANDLTARLTALGVANSTARKLLKEHDPAVVYRWICYTEHKLRNDWIPKETPAAWLVSAIRSKDWVIPEWFQTPEERAAAEAEQIRIARAEQERRETAEAKEREETTAQRRALEERLGVDDQTREIWNTTRTLLQERLEMTPALFCAFLLPLTDSQAIIATPVQMFCEIIPRHADAIHATLEEVSGKKLKGIEVRHIEWG